MELYCLIDGATSFQATETLVFLKFPISLPWLFKDSSYQTQIFVRECFTSARLFPTIQEKYKVLTQTSQSYPKLPKANRAPAGTYTGNFSLRVFFKTRFLGRTLQIQIHSPYTANVNPVIDVRVGSALDTYATGDTAYNIDLGEVSHGASAQFGIFIRANTAYTLTMSATSGGYLTSGTTTDKIQYTLTIDSMSYALGSGILIDKETAKGMYSKAFIGQVSVPADQNVEAGQYSDTISFSITSN